MHFALPPRKTSRPPPYVASRPPASSYRRRGRIKLALWTLGGLLFLIILLSQFRGGRSNRRATNRDDEKVPSGTPRVVVVTAIDPALPETYRDLIEQNRRLYAEEHGYAVFMPKATDYDISTSTKDIPLLIPPISWAKIPSVRHAMTAYPHSTYFFFLGERCLIANPTLSLERHILHRQRLETLIIPNQSIVPPTSVIKTPNTRSIDNVHLIMTQDHEGLRQESFILHRGEWAKFFLDSWFDPLYRSYNFASADGHALEHLVQWHGTVLARLALVPQKVMNSYFVGTADELFAEGDFVANLHGCDNSTARSCESEARAVFDKFKIRLDAAT